MMHNFDLNSLPHSEDVNTNLEVGLPFAQLRNQDPNNDEVAIISQELFQQAVNRSRSNQPSIQIPYADVRTQRGVTVSWDANASGLQTVPTAQVSDAIYHNAQRDARALLKDEDVPGSSQPQQRVPAYSCPICMEEFVEETTTRCGHVFCRSCIVAALNYEKKCPVCRKRVRARDIFRIYLSRR